MYAIAIHLLGLRTGVLSAEGTPIVMDRTTVPGLVLSEAGAAVLSDWGPFWGLQTAVLSRPSRVRMHLRCSILFKKNDSRHDSHFITDSSPSISPLSQVTGQRSPPADGADGDRQGPMGHGAGACGDGF